jgi:putative hydrolase of the HAD superfamily
MYLPRPKAVLFDLFATLAAVPSPEVAREIAVSHILGVSGDEWHRLYYDDDVLGRCLGHVVDGLEAMRSIARKLNPTVEEERILAATESRRRRFELGLTGIDSRILDSIDRLRAAGIRTALVSDAGADDVEGWERSPLRTRFDATVFSFKVGFRKPDPRIYRHALDTIGIEPADAIFVGDGGSDEHRGARAVGMKAVLVTRLIDPRAQHRIPERRPHVDWEFEDVPAFVKALGLQSA